MAPASNSSITPMMWTSFGHSRLKCAAWCAPGGTSGGLKLLSRYSSLARHWENMLISCDLFLDFWTVGAGVHESTMVQTATLQAIYRSEKQHGRFLALEFLWPQGAAKVLFEPKVFMLNESPMYFAGNSMEQ